MNFVHKCHSGFLTVTAKRKPFPRNCTSNIVFKLQDYHHSVCRKRWPQNDGLTSFQANIVNFRFLAIVGNQDPFRGLNIVFGLQDYRHSIFCQFLWLNDGLTFSKLKLNLSIFCPKQGFYDPFWNPNINLGLHHSICRKILPQNGGMSFFKSSISNLAFLAHIRHL